MSMSTTARLKTARTYLTSVLVNLPIITTETSVANFLVLLDQFIDNPEEYEQFRQHKNIQQQRKPTQDEFKSEKHFSEIYCPIAPFKISKDKLGTLLLVILL